MGCQCSNEPGRQISYKFIDKIIAGSIVPPAMKFKRNGEIRNEISDFGFPGIEVYFPFAMLNILVIS